MPETAALQAFSFVMQDSNGNGLRRVNFKILALDSQQLATCQTSVKMTDRA